MTQKVTFKTSDGREGTLDAPDDWSREKIASEIDSIGKPSAAPNEAEKLTESERRLVGVGRSFMKPVEAVQEVYGHLTGDGKASAARARSNTAVMQDIDVASAKDSATRPGGANAGNIQTATDIATGAMLPGLAIAKIPSLVGKMVGGGLTGMGYGVATNPTAGTGDFASEKAKQGIFGFGAGAGLTGILGGLSRAIPAIRERFTKTPEKPQSTEGAERVAGELQRSRDVVEGNAPGVTMRARPSDIDKARFEISQATDKFQQSLKTGTVDLDPALKQIDSLLKWKALDAGGRAALTEARNTINRAVENSAAQTPKIIPGSSFRGGDMNTAQYRQLLEGKNKGAVVPMELADEVRQTINGIIERKGEQALGEVAQKRLLLVNKALTDAAPNGYRKALADLAIAHRGMNKYAPKETVLGKTTLASDLDRLKGGDAQEAINKALSGDRATRDLKELVDLTKHDPKLSLDLRQAVGNWMNPRKTEGGRDITGTLKRWDDLVQAKIKDSGMFAPDHYAAIENVVKQVRDSKSSESAREVAGGAIGWILSSGKLFGIHHPFMGYAAGKRLAGGLNPGVERNLDILITGAVTDPAVAKLLSGPVTPQTIPALNALAEKIAAPAGRAAGEQRPARSIQDAANLTGAFAR